MNLRLVVNQFGLLLLGLAGIMSALAAIYFGIEIFLGQDAIINPAARKALLISAGIGFLVGGALWTLTRKAPKVLGRREALLLVAMSWLAGAAFAALPYFMWANLSDESLANHPFQQFSNCYFESMSGLTTTGATVLGGPVLHDIEHLPRSLLLWRATTHWIGGLGIVVLFVAVLPSLGVGGKKLFRMETTGPKKEGLQPQIRETARVLWYIYLGMTIVQACALKVAGMEWFDAICHTFATLATGGFSTKNASIGYYYEMPAIRIIVIFFMVLAGANFGLYYQLIRGKFRSVFGDAELRLYLTLLIVGSTLVFVSLLFGPDIERTVPGVTAPPTTGVALRQAVFNTVSIQTTTGFCTSDFNGFPFLAKAVLVLLMFFGGCAGSTAGGIKVIRIWIVFKVMISEIERVFRPNVIRTVRVGGGKIDSDTKLAAVVFALGMIILFVGGSGAIMMLEQLNPHTRCDFTTASTASIATLCTIGPGLGNVGAIEHYGWFSPASKYVMCLLMALGRLEVFAIIVLFTPRFWHGD